MTRPVKSPLAYMGVNAPNPPNLIEANRAPTTDDRYTIGTIVIDKSTNNIYILTSYSSGEPVWTLVSTDAVSTYVVDDNDATAYQTVQAAIDAANAAGVSAVVYVRPGVDGVYTENLTLYDGIMLQGAGLETTITGVHTPPTSGRITFYDLTLTSATDIVESNAAGTTRIMFFNCVINCEGGFTLDLENWTGPLMLIQCADSSTANGVVHNLNSGSADVTLWNSVCGAGTFYDMDINGSLTMYGSRLVCGAEIGESAHATISMGSSLGGQIDFENDSTGTITDTTLAPTSSEPAITHDSTGQILLSNCTIDTDNDPAIDGAGAGDLILAGVNFLDNTTIAGTLTLATSGVVQHNGMIRLLDGTTISGAGSTVISTAATNDMDIELGDDAGTNKLTISNNSGTERASIDSQGDIIGRNINVTNTNIESFNVDPILQSNANTGAAPTGATGDYNIMYCQNGVTMTQFILGAGQTIIAPRLEDDGLLISLDLANSEGAEYYFGHTTRSRHAFTIGTDAAFFVEATFKVADCGTSDPLWLGFRKLGAPDGDYTNYTDAAFIGLRDTTGADTIVIGDNLNGAGYTYTDTTDDWLDGETHTLRVNVAEDGVVTYLIDGAAPTATHALTFDDTDVVIPCIHHLFAAGGSPAAIHLQDFKCGYQN